MGSDSAHRLPDEVDTDSFETVAGTPPLPTRTHHNIWEAIGREIKDLRRTVVALRQEVNDTKSADAHLRDLARDLDLKISKLDRALHGEDGGRLHGGLRGELEKERESWRSAHTHLQIKMDALQHDITELKTLRREDQAVHRTTVRIIQAVGALTGLGFVTQLGNLLGWLGPQ